MTMRTRSAKPRISFRLPSTVYSLLLVPVYCLLSTVYLRAQNTPAAEQQIFNRVYIPSSISLNANAGSNPNPLNCLTSLPAGRSLTTQQILNCVYDPVNKALYISLAGGGGGGSMTWPSGGAGIPNYSGSNSWGTTYSASNTIPANFLPTLNQSTTGSAASLSISGQTALLTFTGLTSTNRAKTVRDAADTLLELGGSYTPTGTWNWTSATVTWPTFNQSTTGNAATATNLASYPALCSGAQFSQGLSSGSNNCATPAGGGNVSTSGSPAQYQVAVFASGTTIGGITPSSTSGVPLISQGSSTNVVFGAINLAGGSSVVTGTLPNADLANSSITIAGTAVSLGGSTSSFPSPGAIGGTSPAAGSFTTLSATNSITDSAFSSAGVVHNSSAGLFSSSLVNLTSGTDVTGVLPISDGGTGNGTTVSAYYFFGNATGSAAAPGFYGIPAAAIPTLNQNTTGTASNVTGTVAVANGGTGQTTANAGFNALSPMTTLGDLIYENATPAAARLAGNTTSTLDVLTQTGTGSASAAPGWNSLASINVPTQTGTITTGDCVKWASGTSITDSGAVCGSGGGGMTYPSAGIPVSTGSAWGTSLSETDGDMIAGVSGSWTKVGTLPTALVPALSGDLSGTAGSLAVTVAKVNGVSVSGTPNAGQIPIASSGTAAAWGDPTVSQSNAANLNATVVGAGTAGSPSGGVVSVQGVSSGTPVPISGTVSGTGSAGSAASGVVTVQGIASMTPVQTNATQLGGSTLYVDPCMVNTPSVAQINLAASGQIITGTSGKQTYICGIFLVTATAQNISIVEGTGTTCGTSTTGMSGGNTAATGQNWAANGGFVAGFSQGWVMKTATSGDNVCLLLSSTGQTSGHIKYVQQ